MIPWEQPRPFRTTRVGLTARRAFSLLELMLALGLLGALLAVAWSLLGTYRDAEVRGWKLAHRVQTVRSARAWLEWDAQHLILSSDAAMFGGAQSGQSAFNGPSLPLVHSTKQTANQTAMPHRFKGTAMGFTATIAPSIDPIPFLENLMSDATQPDRETQGIESLMEEANSDTAFNSPWPDETIEIEYRLTPMTSASTRSESTSVSTSLGGEMDGTQYVLTRYEKISSPSQISDSNPSERLLSAQDLYRQVDENSLDGNQSYRESRLEGLTKVQFRYFDGNSWKSNWNSEQQGGLPRAIALGFDFPANSEIQLPSTKSSESTEEEDSMSDLLSSSEMPFEEAELAIESIVESSSAGSPAIMESSTSEVQIVVLVANGVAKSADALKTLPQRARP